MKTVRIWLLLFLATLPAVAGTPCATSLGKCPTRGCAKPNTSDALSNIAKRNLNVEGNAKTITFTQMKDLQAEVEQMFDGHFSTLTKPDRVRLRKIKIGSKTFGEGDLVELVGFLASGPGDPHPNTSGESVNCRIKGTDNNDFHISITEKANGLEFDGVVVEMIPQKRSEDWTIKTLKKARTEKRRVRVSGQLFFDNHHQVNDEVDSGSTQPKRMSLWEIHPITEFEVCTQSTCSDTSGWKTLEDWNGGNQ